MASEPKTIEVEPGGELDRLLDEARRTPLRLVRGGESFRVNLEEDAQDVWAGYDPELARESARAFSGRIRDAGPEPTEGESPIPDDADRRPSPERVARSIEGIRKAAGAWVGNVDAEAFKAYVRERRRTANRPPVRWPE
jgi:hypothetical protein